MTNITEKLELNIVADFPTFSVIEKPSGLLSVPGRGPEKFDSIASRFREHFPESIQQPAAHRLDMATSGLIIMAKTKEAHRHFSIQFQKRTVHKQYEALIEGILESEGGTIELPFRLDIDNRPHQIYDEVYGKMGTTHWKNLGVEGEFTRVDFTPITGRTHQLRIHSAHEKGLGFPIVGDFLYGNGTDYNQLKLHAYTISFDHPKTGERLEFSSQVPF